MLLNHQAPAVKSDYYCNTNHHGGKMSRVKFLIVCLLFIVNYSYSQSPSFRTFMNPVIPGDHPDCTLSKFGDDFYTTGSSFNPTPVIYHSTDLVHWEAIAQPVSPSWSLYVDAPAGGCWGGHLVYYNNKYWHFFGKNAIMYYVTANDPAGPWSHPPVALTCPPELPGLGMDNSIFIDDDNSWYLLVKNGQSVNWIVQLGDDGQPYGALYNLSWLNPAPGYPYSWAEGPVMWKYKGYYYYCFAINLAGGQKVMRSATLTEDQSSWEMLGDFFNESDPKKSSAIFQGPNHSSSAIMLEDSTWWVIYHANAKAGSNEWHGIGRQGLISQVRYNEAGKPTADYCTNEPHTAPALPSSGIPWMVPKSDFFTAEKLNPEWSFLGYTPDGTYSLTARPGWFRLSPKGKENTIIKNDAEHNYSLITRVDFNAAATADQAGLWIFNGPQTLFVKLYSTVNTAGNKVIAFSFDATYYETPNTAGNIVWLRLIRINHVVYGYFSADGVTWSPVGESINVASMDKEHPNFNDFTGNRQGIYVKGSPADFDLYIYRDAYSPILAECPANQYGVTASTKKDGIRILDNIHNTDWALYAGMEFGNNEYVKTPAMLEVIASSDANGGLIEVWLDSLDTGTKVGECVITGTGSMKTFKTFTGTVAPITGRHDVYLKFTGTGEDKLFQLKWLRFLTESEVATSLGENQPPKRPIENSLQQNYPNPFNPTTEINFSIAEPSFVSLKVFNLLGKEINELAGKSYTAGRHSVTFDASNLASGIYFYKLNTGHFLQTRKMFLVR